MHFGIFLFHLSSEWEFFCSWHVVKLHTGHTPEINPTKAAKLHLNNWNVVCVNDVKILSNDSNRWHFNCEISQAMSHGWVRNIFSRSVWHKATSSFSWWCVHSTHSAENMSMGVEHSAKIPCPAVTNNKGQQMSRARTRSQLISTLWGVKWNVMYFYWLNDERI